MIRALIVAIGIATLALPAAAQNEVRHYDGTTAFTSRGVSATDEKGLLQRLPGDQIGTASHVHSHSFEIQDQDVCTTEPMTVVIYGNDPSGAPTGEPDVVSPIASGNVTLDASSQCPGAFAFSFTVTWNTPITLPFQDCAVPANDIYVGIRMPAQPLWPADGLSLHASTTEDENPSTIGYAGAAGVPGLGWEINFGPSVIKQLATSDRAWNVGTRFLDDVLQPFAANNPAHEDPHFGYAGLFPDPSADHVGVRLRSSSPAGGTTKAWLYASVSLLPKPWTSPPFDGAFCLAGPLFLVPPSPQTTVAPSGVATSEATWGPFFPIPCAPGRMIYLQAIVSPSSSGNFFRFSTLCTVRCP